jgi:hypothetical protein
MVQDYADKYARAFLDAFGPDHCTTYTHDIAYHIADRIRAHGSPAKYSMQGAEHAHSVHSYVSCGASVLCTCGAVI